MRNFILALSVIFSLSSGQYASAQGFWYTPPGYELGYFYGLDVANGVGFGYGAGIGIAIPAEAFRPQSPTVLHPQSWDEFTSSASSASSNQATRGGFEYKPMDSFSTTTVHPSNGAKSKIGASTLQHGKVAKKAPEHNKTRKAVVSN